MLTQADDEGRLVADPEQLRGWAWMYHQKVSVAMSETALEEIAAAGLVRVYRKGDTRYVDFPSWLEHQAVNHPTPSKLPPYDALQNSQEDSVDLQNITASRARADPTGREGNGREGNLFSSASGRPVEDSGASPDGTKDREGPEALLAAWREIATTTKRPGLPGLIVPDAQLTAKRREGALRRLKEAELAWHRQAILRLSRSAFACGRPKPDGSRWRASFDWYLANENNPVKAHEGRYDDATES